MHVCSVCVSVCAPVDVLHLYVWQALYFINDDGRAKEGEYGDIVMDKKKQSTLSFLFSLSLSRYLSLFNVCLPHSLHLALSLSL